MANINRGVINRRDNNTAQPIVGKFCPFKKAIDYTYGPLSNEIPDIVQLASIESFRGCIKDLCMSYQYGECVLLKKSN